mmetsp:Transcript_29970/g.45665  ORF Transcript_29970/g.45665 Transcript_29970/m.45665 type:complete len:334 (+) Transcript_29970:40-1041(+)
MSKMTSKQGKATATNDGDDDEDQKHSEDDSGDDSEDDDLVLEGVLVRNPDVSDSDSESSDSDLEDEEAIDKSVSTAISKKDDKKSPNQKASRKRKKPASREPDIVQVEFVFWDMKEKFFHGIKTLLQSCSTIYAAQSSSLSDLMIENVSIGTVVSTEGDEEGNVFAFASVLNVTTNGSQNCIKYLKKLCMDKCPDNHKAELKTVLSGETKRPAGFLLHSRMVNLPLEIVETLHQQLVLDMDWAVENAEGGIEERKSLDYGAFVRLAPATPGDHGSVVYKYFDDEIFANNAEFSFTIDAPKSYASEEKQLCRVIVITKTGHRDAMKDLKRLVGS